MVFSTDGFVCRVMDTGGSEKYIRLITPTRGRLQVLVQGGKSPKSGRTACSQLFIWGNYEIGEENGRYWLQTGSVNHVFSKLPEDLAAFSLASYLCEAAEELTDEGETTEGLLRLLLNCMYGLDLRLYPLSQIKAVFELRAAVLSGYCPELSTCRACGRDCTDTDETVYADVMDGALLCAHCLTAAHADAPAPTALAADEVREASVLYPLTPHALAAARFVRQAPLRRVLSFRLERAADLASFSAFAENYLLHHLGRGFQTLQFYKEVERHDKNR